VSKALVDLLHDVKRSQLAIDVHVRGPAALATEVGLVARAHVGRLEAARRCRTSERLEGVRVFSIHFFRRLGSVILEQEHSP